MAHVAVKADFPQHGLTVKLSLFTFIEENVHVVYSPALDLYGYGNDEHEARHSFEVALQEYILHTAEHKTLDKDLKKYGWTIDKKHGALQSPDVSTLLQKNSVFKNFVNTHAFKKFDVSVQLPAVA
ncbi:MAG: hypothetical protein V4642_06885 [Bacteroidota bacterium]